MSPAPMDAASEHIADRLRQKLREVLRASPALWAEFRRAKRARRPSVWAVLGVTLTLVLLVPVMFFAWPLAIIRLLAEHGGVDLLLGLVGLASLGGTLLLARGLVAAFEQSRTLSVSSHLPVEDAEIARNLWWSMAGASCLGLYFAGLPYGYVAWTQGFGLSGWLLVFGLAAAQCVTAVAVATALVLARPRWPYAGLGIIVWAVAVAIGAALLFRPALVRAPVVAEVLYRLTPGGWLSGVLGRGFIAGRLEAWWGLVSVAFLAAVTAPMMRRLSASYEVLEFSFRPDAEAVARIVGPLSPDAPRDPAAESEDSPQTVEDQLDEVLGGRERPPATSAVLDAIRRRTFLEELSWTRGGPVERVVSAILSERERVLIEFLTAGRPGWTQVWATLLLTLPAAIVAGLFGFIGPWLLIMIVVWVSVAAVVHGPWRGFHWRRCTGTYLPNFAVVPIEYREASRAMFKAGLVRCLFVLPAAELVVLYVAGAAGIPLATAALGTAGFVGLLVLGQPLLITVLLSAGLRLPAMNRWTWLLVLVPIACAIMSCVGIGVTLIGLAGPVAGGWKWAASGLGLVAAGSLGLSGFYSLLHRRGRVDLATSRLSSFEQNLAANYEKYERARLRADIAREHFGRLWWLRRDLRRWAARTE